MLRARIDIKGLQKFKRELQKLEKGAEREELIRECLIEIAKRAIRKVRKRTPVNTGKLRSDWKIGDIKKSGDTYDVDIFTDNEYAPFVENGFRAHFVPGYWEGKQFVYDKNAKTGMQVGKPGSWVSGKFMLRISTKEVEQEMPRIIEHRKKKFLESRLK